MSIRQFAKVSAAVLVTIFLLSCSVAPNPPAAPLASDPPAVLMVVPQTNGVGTNRSVAVVFSKAMDPATISADTFVVAGVSGTVTYDAANKIGAFTPSTEFAASTMYNASITLGAKDTSGP